MSYHHFPEFNGGVVLETVIRVSSVTPYAAGHSFDVTCQHGVTFMVCARMAPGYHKPEFLVENQRRAESWLSAFTGRLDALTHNSLRPNG